MYIYGIPTETFNRIIDDLGAEGWETTYQYTGMDVGIDYDKVILAQNDTTLTFEWDNWTEGEIEGPEALLKELQIKYALTDRVTTL